MKSIIRNVFFNDTRKTLGGLSVGCHDCDLQPHPNNSYFKSPW